VTGRKSLSSPPDHPGYGLRFARSTYSRQADDHNTLDASINTEFSLLALMHVTAESYGSLL
jgi:hypothetical protein